MSLSIRRGASRVFQISFDNCDNQDILWNNFEHIRVRLSQGDVVVDKMAVIDQNDATACLVYYSQEDTIRFKNNSTAKLQIFLIKESEDHQIAIKTNVFDVVVGESLWNEVVTDGIYSGNESLAILDPEYSEPIGHDYYSYLHIDIKEYHGIISEKADVIIDGTNLYYDPSTETIFASAEDHSSEG